MSGERRDLVALVQDALVEERARGAQIHTELAWAQRGLGETLMRERGWLPAGRRGSDHEAHELVMLAVFDLANWRPMTTTEIAAEGWWKPTWAITGINLRVPGVYRVLLEYEACGRASRVESTIRNRAHLWWLS